MTPRSSTTTKVMISRLPEHRAAEGDEGVRARSSLGAQEGERHEVDRVEEDDRADQRHQQPGVGRAEQERRQRKREGQEDDKREERHDQPQAECRSQHLGPAALVARLIEVRAEERVGKGERRDERREGEGGRQNGHDAVVLEAELARIDRDQHDRERLVGDATQAVHGRLAEESTQKRASRRPDRWLGWRVDVPFGHAGGLYPCPPSASRPSAILRVIELIVHEATPCLQRSPAPRASSARTSSRHWSRAGTACAAMVQYNSFGSRGWLDTAGARGHGVRSRSSSATSAIRVGHARVRRGRRCRLPPGRPDRDPVLLPAPRTPTSRPTSAAR